MNTRERITALEDRMSSIEGIARAVHYERERKEDSREFWADVYKVVSPVLIAGMTVVIAATYIAAAFNDGRLW